MKAFTPAILTALLAQALEEIDPSLLEGVAPPDPMSRAVVPETAKRTLLARALERHGPGPLLCVGQNLRRAEEHPIVAVLTGSPYPDVLAEKWMRLERYLHSAHRSAIAPRGERAWRCLRRSVCGPAPSFAENCLIAGVLMGLLGEIGVHEPTLIVGGRSFSATTLPCAQFPEMERLLAFELAWSADQRSLRQAERGDERRPVKDRLADLLAADIGRSWRVADAARALALSERTLQRKLAEEGRSFSSVLRRARMRAASAMLMDGASALADIGYCCGYADQAHFQRDFLRATNMTPRAFQTISAPGS